MSLTAQVRAQAKINLFLRILAREASGYHGLETLFARLDLADEITLHVGGNERRVDCRGADVGPAESNLAFRAAAAYADATGWPNGFSIEIDKRIPLGGGLGGGSADAGAVLRALNALAPAAMAPEALLVMAGRLGADVPFLTTEAPLALAWGRGDRLLELPALPTREVALICFPFGVSSAAAFGWVAESRPGPSGGVPATQLSFRGLESWDGVAALAGNDFEEEVGRRHPPITETLAAARSRRPLIAALTGSGSTVVIVPRRAGDLAGFPVPSGATLVRTRTSASVEDIRVTG